MKLLFIRHGDPDYTIDSLTEKGWKEAEFLSEKIAALDVRDFYVSPLGRAKDTASFHRTGRKSKISTALTAGGIMTSCEREK